jgi:hypothetical protein
MAHMEMLGTSIRVKDRGKGVVVGVINETDFILCIKVHCGDKIKRTFLEVNVQDIVQEPERK